MIRGKGISDWFLPDAECAGSGVVTRPNPIPLALAERHVERQVGGSVGGADARSQTPALANREHGRITVNINGDGDLNYAPGALWTAVHHRIPLLTVVHNNRGYHQEVMYLQQQAAARNRGVDRAAIGTTITDPNIDYAQMAKAYGMYAEGPIEHPADLGAALRRGVERVKAGEPALIDVVSQPR